MMFIQVDQHLGVQRHIFRFHGFSQGQGYQLFGSIFFQGQGSLGLLDLGNNSFEHILGRPGPTGGMHRINGQRQTEQGKQHKQNELLHYG